MSDEQKQKQRDYQIEYRKKYYAANFYSISIIIKLKKNIVPIKDINSILKINKKVCSQVY